MKLLVGLGNPGEKYKNNRHNVGFMFADYLVNELSLLRPGDMSGLRKGKQVCGFTLNGFTVNGFKKDKYSHSELAKLVINNKEIILCKPQTFMNKSGLAVKSCVKRYTLNVTQDVIVVHDDLDIPLGKFKIQKGSGPKLHNGIESIEKSLASKDFLRVRVGIDDRQKIGWVDGETYVLQNFLPEERELLFDKAFPRLLSEIKICFLS